MRATLVAIGLVTLAVACGDEDWKGEGKVIEHRYDDDDSYMMPPIYHPAQPGSCSGSGINAICTGGQSAWIQPGYWVNQPERWLLVVQGDKGDNHTVSVSRSTYESCPDGRYYSTETGVCRAG